MQWLDYVEVTYPRLLRADGDQLLLRSLTPGIYTVSGFSSPDIRVIQAPGSTAATLRENVTIQPGTDGSQVTFKISQPSDVLLATAASEAAPARIVADVPTLLRTNKWKVDYLIIAPRALTATAEALQAWRAQTFPKATIVWLDDIEQEFGAGRPGSQSVDAFLDYAATQWKKAPSMVVLLGRGTLDHRDLMGYGNSLIPVPMVDTPWGLTPSDFPYAQVGQTVGYALGRIPVVDDTEGLAYLAKLQAADAAVPGLAASTAVVVADNPDDAGDFHANADALSLDLSARGYGVTRLYRCTTGETDPACTDVRAALTRSATWEAALINYSGHGSVSQLGDGKEKFLQRADVAGLQNVAQPLFAGMTCLVGLNFYPQWRSLTEAMILRQGGGAIATLTPSGQSLDADAQQMNLSFIGSLTSGASIGEAAQDAANDTRGSIRPFMEQIYQVTGDAAVRLP